MQDVCGGEFVDDFAAAIAGKIGFAEAKQKVGLVGEAAHFESGLTAAWFGTAPSVVIGGAGTCLVVLLFLRLFPRLRSVDTPPRPPEKLPASA